LYGGVIGLVTESL